MSYLINKETGAKIASTPEELPPLRDGYVRLIHQTHFDYADSLLENGLIYNSEYAGKYGFSKYSDVTSMAVAYGEDEFWERLTSEDTRHKGANAIAIFDMPLEECGAHQRVQITPMLNGTISRGYMVGIIPNYGTKDSENGEKLSITEMEEKKEISKFNPLPQNYETPNWRENIDEAWTIFRKQHEDSQGHSWFSHDAAVESNSVNDNADFDDGGNWDDWDDLNETAADNSSKSPEYVFNESTGMFDYKNPEFQKKAEQRRKSSSENRDYFEYKLQCIRNKLGNESLEVNMGKTGNSRTGEISSEQKRISEIQTETAKTSSVRFNQTTKNR